MRKMSDGLLLSILKNSGATGIKNSRTSIRESSPVSSTLKQNTNIRFCKIVKFKEYAIDETDGDILWEHNYERIDLLSDDEEDEFKTKQDSGDHEQIDSCIPDNKMIEAAVLESPDLKSERLLANNNNAEAEPVDDQMNSCIPDNTKEVKPDRDLKGLRLLKNNKHTTSVVDDKRKRCIRKKGMVRKGLRARCSRGGKKIPCLKENKKDFVLNLKKTGFCTTAETANIYVVEKILGRRTRKAKIEYFIKWRDFPSTENTWEPENNLDQSLLAKINEAIN